jgi:2C-methyl-D-erythritol 2,4-cyclodiphosphate synthase|nr:MAG TPA: Large polyvalent protein associated domain 23 [Caudoviricetes sp.]
MSSIRERLLGKSKSNSSIRDRLELNSSYYKQEYDDQLSKRNNIQKDIQKNTYEKGVQTTVTPFSTQRNILPIQEQTEITKNKRFEVTAGQDKLGQNKSIENKYQEIKKTNEYKNQMKQLEEQSNEVGYAKYNYDKQRIAEDDIGWYDKSIGRFTGGIGSLFDYNGGLIKNENGDLEYLPTFNQMKHQKVKENYKTGIGRFAGDVLYESGKIAGSTLINQALPGVGSTMYFGKMFVDSTNQAVSDGYDTSSATMYGLVNVGLEYGVGKILGSATKGLTGGKNGDYEELLKKTFTNITKKPKIANILANAGSEATEEFVQEYLDNISKLLILDKNTNIKDYASVFLDGDVLSDALYSAAIGGVTGGIIGTATGKDTNVENKDVNLYKTFKEELEETKKNTTNKETINKIDTIISNINSNINNNSNVNANVDTITSQISEYETLKEQNKLTNEQEIELNELKNQLSAIQNQNTDTSTSIKEEANLPTVQDIVNQEKSSQSGINLPVYNQQSNINNSDRAILPTVNDFNSSNMNMPISDIKVDMAKISPEILNDIKGFKLGDPSIESYKGSYIKTMLNEVGIKVPTAMNYVSEVRPDMSFTTTKDLTRQQYASIGNALQKLRSVDVTGVNNANYSIPIGNYQYVKSSNANINELRRTASMYLNNTARSNNTIKLLENIIKDRNYIIRFNPNITNEQGVPVNGLITKENGKTIIELNPNADNYVEFLVVHEITHDIATKAMKELILDYAKQDPEFEKSLESLKERYKTNDVSDEIVADVCGELFGNREFIQSVVEKKPNIFKKILNNIRKLAEKIKGTGANEYVSFVEKLKTMWEGAYYSNKSNLKKTEYMMTGIKGARNAIKNDSYNQFLNDNYNKALIYKKNNIENEQIRRRTGWFQDSKGDWKFELSDDEAKIIKKLEKNNTYQLKEILEHNDLYEMYPNLKNNKVKFTDFGIRTDENGKKYIKKGRINNITNTISLNNELISKGNDAVLDTLIHEIQHRIQKIEKFTQGTTSAIGFENYQNNFGEKEARDTSNRRKMNYETRLKTPPISSLTDNIIDKNKNKWYSLNEVEQDAQENNTISSQNVSENIYSRGKLGRNTKGQELENSSFYLEKYKQKQLDIIKSNNPVNDDYHTWIRNVEDIKTLEETINDSDWSNYDEYNPDLSRQDIENAIDSGKIMVYSSYPIKQGVFVSPSKMEAESYSSNGKVYSKEVNINDVAWIDPTQGQYAKVYDILPTKYSQSTKEWNDYLKENFPSSGTKTKMSDIKLPVSEDIESSSKKSKILNPNEISKLTDEDANTTPILLKRGSVNKVNDGNSHFAKNIKDKVNMLNVEQKAEILSKEDVRYYDKVTNKESLEKAFKKINDGGSSETLRWVKQDSKNANATDVAEGWILLKQYADNGDYDSMVEVAKKMREIGTIAGQTVQAFNIMERMTPEGMVKYAQSELSEAYDKMVKNKSKEWIDKYRKDFDLKPDEVKFIMDTMQEVQNMEDGYDKRVKLAEIQKLMTDKLPPEKGAKIRSWMRISMLFNPKTQVRNVAGNALIMPVNSFGDLFSSYADRLIAKKTGVRTTGTTNVKAMLKGIKKGAYEATNDYKKGINTKDMEGNRFEISDGKSFSEKNLMGRTLNRTESLLNYVMDVGDRVFSEAAFENSLQNQLVLNNTIEITQEMIDIAHQEALSRTWNDNNNYTRFVLGVRKGLNKLNVNGYGLGDILIPFAKTPANLTKAIVDYSPAGLVSAINKGINLKRSLANGQYTATMQHEFVQSLGKATAGTMLYILGIALAKAGITSGDSDDDKDTANFLKNTLGINSYSIKIGGKSFTYDWAQPLAAPLSITANVVNSKSGDSKALLEGIVGSLDSAGSILLEQSFLQSINDVLNDNDGVVSGIINEILELPARAVPTFSKQIADLVDGTQRTSFEYGKPIQSAVNSIKAKIPFVSKTLNPAVDTMGREIQKYGGKNNIFNVFLNPANVGTENISESAEEIYRLYKETGETDVMPRVAPYYINQKGEKIMMTGKDRVEYQKISGEIIEDNIKKLINNASYSSMSDSDKANVVKDIVNYSYNIAKKDVLGLELSNTYQKAYEYSEIGDIGDYYTFKESIDNTDKDTKKASITKFLIDSDLTNEQLAYLYGNYYSSDKVLNALVQSNIPIKEYIKFNSETFESDYYTNGKTVPNSRKNKVIKYINSLNLSIPQKAMLIKMEYSSFKQYDNQIVKYVNNIDCSSYDKKVILKTIGFTSYDKDIINTINSKNISVEEKTKELEELGFKVRNGRVYTK